MPNRTPERRLPPHQTAAPPWPNARPTRIIPSEARRLLFALTLAGLACSAEEPIAVEVDPALGWQVEYVSGERQVGIPGRPLDAPFVVRVRDGDGRDVPGARVVWRMQTGPDAYVTEGVTITDAQGLAGIQVTPLAVRVRFRAEIEGLSWKRVWFETVPHSIAVYQRVSPTPYCRDPACELITFYADGSWGLHTRPLYELPGTYTRQGSLLHLQLSGSDRWFGIGAIDGDSLAVRYSDVAGLEGFEDGTFRLVEGALP